MIAGGVRADGVIGEEGRRVSESRGKKKRKTKGFSESSIRVNDLVSQVNNQTQA